MALNVCLLQLPRANQTVVGDRKRSLERVVEIVTRVDLSVVPRRQVPLVIGLTGAGPISLLSGRQDQMDLTEEVLGRCWVNHQQVRRKTEGGQVSCWEEVHPLILLMAGAAGLNKGLRISTLGRRAEAEGQVSQEGARMLGVNLLF